MARRENSNGRGGKGGGRRPPAMREVTISKALSFLLRHGGRDEGVEMDEGGWANVADVLQWRRLLSLKVTFSELQQIVASNDKQRFVLEPNPDPDLPQSSAETTSSADISRWRIRASQGHSLTTLSDEKIYMKILPTDTDCPSLLVHGTYDKPWQEIKRSGGLKPMGRTHIHFADRLPKRMPPLDPVYQSNSKVKEEADTLISGMRPGSTVVVWVDVRKSMQAGVEWWRSRNGVFLTKGVEGEKEGEGLLGFEFFKWVERRAEGDGEVLFGEKVPRVGIAEEADDAQTKMGALSVGEGPPVEEKRNQEKKDEVVAVVKDSWDDGEE